MATSWCGYGWVRAPARFTVRITGALNTFRQLGYALGIAVLGLVLRFRIEDGLTGHVADPHGVAGAASGGRAPHLAAVRSAFASGLDAVYVVCGTLGLVAGVLVLVFVRGPGRAPRPQPEREAVSA